MRRLFAHTLLARMVCALWLLGAFSAPALADVPAAPGFEITRKHIDIDVLPGGGYAKVSQTAYKILTLQGRDVLRQFELSYTAGFQSLTLVGAYTRKADGRKIQIGSNDVLFGHGASSQPGFSDDKTITVIFPDLEIGDEVVLETYFRQISPWFAGQFFESVPLTRALVAHDVRLTLTAPEDMAIQIDAKGLTGGKRQTAGGKTYWVWDFDNPVAQRMEDGAADEADYGPHLELSSFADYAAVAGAYRALLVDKARVTPEIQALADRLTQNISGRRAQARVLYDWVSANISYVALVLGAGGFTPHAADDVLTKKYGDCKDHVMLLQALLSAKGIASEPVLISTGSAYRLSTAPSPSFDHMMTYLPQFDLFADSTAQFAPFGTLPRASAAKPALRLMSGKTVRTPRNTAQTYEISATSQVTISPEGTATGHSVITATGAANVEMRASIDAIAPDGEDNYLRSFLGPRASGRLERGDPQTLGDAYRFAADYTVPQAANIPGPGALDLTLGYKPFSFTAILGGTLPAQRRQDWLCPSLRAEEDMTITLPPGIAISAHPASEMFRTRDITLELRSTQLSANSLRQSVRLVADHPGPICSAEYYEAIRGDLEKMLAALRAQIVYRKDGTP